MNENLKKQAFNGMMWNFLERVGLRSVRLVTIVILARLLLPEHFGLIGMLAIFIAISRTFLDSGFSQALIQKKDTTQADYSTVFYFNIVIGFFLFVIFYVSAPLIATFFSQPDLKSLTRFMGLSFIINSFAIVQNTILVKKIAFKKLMKINTVSAILTGIVSVYMAMKGFGVWSLAVYAVGRRLISTILLWIFTHWLPSEFSKYSFNRLFSFGSKLLVSSLLNTVFENIYSLIIGKTYNAEALGYYSQAQRLKNYPSQEINAVFQKVTFPIFSKMQNDNALLKRGYKKTLGSLVFFNFPVMLGLIVIAKPLISILLTEKWLSSVPYFQLLCLVGFLYPIQSLNLNIIKVKGRTDLFLKLELVKKIIIILSIVVCLPFGVLALIIGQVITSFISVFINTYYSGRFINYGVKEQIVDILPYAFSAILMTSIVGLIGLITIDSNILKILIQIVTGIGFYLIISKILKLNAYKEAIIIIKANFSKKAII